MNKVNLLKCSNGEANRLAKDYLKKALLELMKTKDFSQISITELVKAANISRAGYYNNYTNKYQILKEIVLDINSSILDDVGKPFTNQVDLEWYINLFSKVEEVSSTITLLANAGFQNDYIQIINEYIISRSDGVNENAVCNRLIWNGGIQNIIWFWVKNGMKRCKEEMAKLCYLFLHKDKKYS